MKGKARRSGFPSHGGSTDQRGIGSGSGGGRGLGIECEFTKVRS